MQTSRHASYYWKRRDPLSTEIIKTIFINCKLEIQPISQLKWFNTCNILMHI